MLPLSHPAVSSSTSLKPSPSVLAGPAAGIHAELCRATLWGEAGIRVEPPPGVRLGSASSAAIVDTVLDRGLPAAASIVLEMEKVKEGRRKH